MTLAQRLHRLERSLGTGEPFPAPVVVLAGGSRIADADRPLVSEIAQARARRAWPSGLMITVVTGEDVAAWKAGRTDEAVREEHGL